MSLTSWIIKKTVWLKSARSSHNVSEYSPDTYHGTTLSRNDQTRGQEIRILERLTCRLIMLTSIARFVSILTSNF